MAVITPLELLVALAVAFWSHCGTKGVSVAARFWAMAP